MASGASEKSKGSSFADFDIGAYRTKILSQSTPHIIECIEAGEGGSQEACHLPREKRYAALNQKGVTIWMTGLSGSGKSTIASLLLRFYDKQKGKLSIDGLEIEKYPVKYIRD
jgi:ABC-type multidrug transport system fused ATPase/permease subunit